jgi:hypothetical protein
MGSVGREGLSDVVLEILDVGFQHWILEHGNIGTSDVPT